MATGIKIGKKIRAAFPKTGNRSDGSTWQMFTYNETKKNQQTGNYDLIAKYTVMVNNPILGLVHNQEVNIISITQVIYEKVNKNGNTYDNITVNCGIEIFKPDVNGGVPNYNQNQSYPQNYPQQTYQPPTQTQTMSNFDVSDIPDFNVGISDDDLPF